MHKDVNRTLLLWPAFASATISAAAWLAQTGIESNMPVARTSPRPALRATRDDVPTSRELVAAPHRSDVAHADRAGTQMLHSVKLAVPISASDHVVSDAGSSLLTEAQPRIEHGTRGMQLPSRVARVYGVSYPVAAAPKQTQSCEMPGPVENDWLVDNASPGSSRSSQKRIPTMLRIDGFELLPASILPPSTRTLAKPLLRDAEADVANQPAGPEPDLPVVEEIADREVDRVEEETSVFPEMSALEFAVTPEPASPGDVPLPSLDEVVERAAESKPPYEATPAVKNDVKPLAVLPPDPDSGFAGWPATHALDQQLVSLAEFDQAEVRQWADLVATTLDELQALPRLGDPEAGALLDRLSGLAEQGLQLGDALADRVARVQWLLASHALIRRTSIWKPIWQLGQPRWMVSDEIMTPKNVSTSHDLVSLTAAVGKLKRDIVVTGDITAWAGFLLLDEIEQAARDGSSRERTVIAQRFLSRLQWHGLDAEQRRWLERPSVEHLTEVIRPWARGAVDYANLLRQIEQQEADGIDLGSIDIANSIQSLRSAETAAVTEIGEQINKYYRNANIRLAISGSMIERLMPPIEPQQVPVRTNILGSRVRGQSRVESDLRIQLYPSADRWKLDLRAIGNVRTDSSGFNSGVVVGTRGNAEFAARTPIELGRQGIDVQNADVRVRGDTRLRTVRSEYDGWPVVGSLVRNIARSRYESSRATTNRIANRTIRLQVRDEIDERVQKQVEMASEQLTDVLLGPLGRMDLNPTVMDLQTTESRLLARYRLAGDWQLAAFTPRPRAPQSSLMSLQIHQSALNNLLEQLIPRDRPVTIEELLNRSAQTFGREELELPQDIPRDVTIQFAKTRPVTIEVKEDRLCLTLRVLRLQRGDRSPLTRFIVRAQYMPQIQGVQAQLVRDGHLRISGPGMSARERLPLRAIFNKVLSRNRPIELTMPKVVEHPALEGLAISQLELRDGWIALAVSESDAPRLIAGRWVMSRR